MQINVLHIEWVFFLTLGVVSGPRNKPLVNLRLCGQISGDLVETFHGPLIEDYKREISAQIEISRKS